MIRGGAAAYAKNHYWNLNSVTVMTAKESSEILTEHNKWRRGGDCPMQDPAAIGYAIESVVMALMSSGYEIARLENEIDRLTEANLDMAREIGAKSEPVEYGC